MNNFVSFLFIIFCMYTYVNTNTLHIILFYLQFHLPITIYTSIKCDRIIIIIKGEAFFKMLASKLIVTMIMKHDKQLYIKWDFFFVHSLLIVYSDEIGMTNDFSTTKLNQTRKC